MKSISIYTITRNQNIEQLQKLERQLSGRDYFLKMREWELESMKALTAELETCMEDVYALRFFYSFQIPRLAEKNRIPTDCNYSNPHIRYDGINWWITVGIEYEDSVTVPSNDRIAKS